MLRLLGKIAMLLLCLGVTRVAAAPIDCGPAPSAKCLAAVIFSLAKTLPEDDGFRRRVTFAETELANGDLKTALEYVVGEPPDPPPWEDIEWLARAGWRDRAVERAKQRTSQVERLGGLLAVAALYADKNDMVRAEQIVDDVERELPSVPVADYDLDAGSLGPAAGEIRARLGQLDRAAKLIGGTGEAVDTLLAIARKYPMAARLREQAWQEAERARELRGWQQLVEDAISRGDKAEISSTARRAGKAIGAATDTNDPMWAIPLSRVFLAAGERNSSAELLKQWPRWLEEKNGVMQSHICKELMPVLTGLGRDQEVDAVVRAVNDPADRSQCMAKAAEAYFRLGHRDLAEKFDVEAQDIAEAFPTREPKMRGSHDAALHNLALVRADRGDIDGALISAAKLRDESKIRNVTRYVVQRAIAEGHGPTVGPAIETLEQRAVAAGDAGLLLEAGRDWYAIGKQKEARRSLGQAMKMFDAQQARMSWEAAGLAAELMWRLEGAGKAEAMIGIVDKLKISDPSAIDHLVEFMRPISPVVAIQLSDKQTEVWRRITGLANVAIQIAGDAK